MSDPDRALVGRIASHVSWANTVDRTARTAPARAAADSRFLEQAGGDPVRAEHLRKAYFLQLARKSAEARRKAKNAAESEAVRSELVAVLAELDAAGGSI